MPHGTQPTCTQSVTSNADAGPGSLRDAILQANRIPIGVGVVSILFRLPSGQRTIRPQTPLPTITRPVSIDAREQPGWRGHPLVELDGSLAGTTAATGLLIANTAECVIAGLVINRFFGCGLILRRGGGHRVVNCYFGTDRTGTVAQGNGQHGCALSGCSDTTIGGATAEDRCIASGNSLYGVAISEPAAAQNRIIGCYVGVKRNGMEALPNVRTGVLIYNAPSNTIGGLQPGEGNVISGGARSGINVDGSPTPAAPPNHYSGKGHCHDNRVIGNLIGTTRAGTMALGNVLCGIVICNSQRNTVGGVEPNAQNIICGNGAHGVSIMGSTDCTDDNLIADGNRIVGNWIGVRPTARPLPNARNGVTISHGRNNIVEQNIIRFNGGRGVDVSGFGATMNLIGERNVIANNVKLPEVLIGGPRD